MAQPIKFSIDAAWKVILNDLGLKTSEVLKRAELPPDLFSRKNVALVSDDFFRLWESIEQIADDPLLPLRLGTGISVESFSPPIFAALCSKNLNDAVSRLSHYKKLVGPMTLVVKRGESETSVSLDCLYTDNPLPDSLVEMEFVFLVHLVRLATRQKIYPIRIVTKVDLFRHPDYADYFGVTPITGDVNSISFSYQDALTPFMTENEGMWQFFKPELQKRLSEIDSEASFTSRVQGAIVELLPSGQNSADDVATKLAVSKRTMQRHLSSENTSFQKALNTTREKLARHYLKNSTLTGSEISFLLGFDDPNSFARAFRTWTGTTPEKMRSGTIYGRAV